MKTLIICNRQMHLLEADDKEEIPNIVVKPGDENAVDQINSASEVLNTPFNVVYGANNDNVPNINMAPESVTSGDAPAEVIQKVEKERTELGPKSDKTNTIIPFTSSGKALQTAGKIYTKAKIEEARLSNIRKSGKTYTKKEIDKILLGK